MDETMDKRFLFGVETLDKLFSSALAPGSLVVVAGHPGSGKTTLASTICYANALRGHRCLYISFQESKEKLFRILKGLGLDFSTLEDGGLYRFVRMPIVKSVEDVAEFVNSLVAEWMPSVVVVDSINSLLNVVGAPDKRAWLQNYFYNLSENIDGVVVLIAEVPFEEWRVDLGSAEFVADVVIILKHRIERGLLTRYLEVRKSRGSPITLAELPFSIVPGRGVEVFMPPILSEIGRSGPELKTPCSRLDEILGHIHKGHSIYVEYPPDYRVPEALSIALGVAFRNSLRAIVISYAYSPETMRDLLVREYSRYCKNVNAITSCLDRSVAMFSLNPFFYSLYEGVAEVNRAIRVSQADVIVIHGVDILSLAAKPYPEYPSTLYNHVNMLKQEQKVIIKVGSRISEELSNIHYSLADIVIKFIPSNDYRGYSVYIWRRGLKPVILSQTEIEKCVEDIARMVCK